MIIILSNVNGVFPNIPHKITTFICRRQFLKSIILRTFKQSEYEEIFVEVFLAFGKWHKMGEFLTPVIRYC